MVPLLLFFLASAAEDLPTGKIIDSVACERNPTESYALYIPSGYSPQRLWPVIFAFDPAARGRIPVERYQAAAEAYGYIVAGSNNSRNGSWQSSTEAVQAMTADVARRFAIDDKRLYTAGMSGGARVALAVALGSDRIAGVIASSAGYPDNKARKTVPFAIFGTAGNEDFNLLEMRRLDRELTSPFHLAIFAGGHVWLSSDLAVEAVEWMEIQAMKSGRAPRDPAKVDRIFARRLAAMEARVSDKDRYLDLESMARDFEGLRDVAELAARAERLGREKQVRDALKKDRDEDAREQREVDRIVGLEAQLSSPEERAGALANLRGAWKRLAGEANGPNDTVERRMALRVLRGLAMGAAERVHDPAYSKIVDEFRPVRAGGR